MTEIDSHIEDRDANVRLVISNLMSGAQDRMFEAFDGLHKRGITDEEILLALRNMGEEDLRDEYAEWANIDIREDDNTTMNPAVPDPGDAPSYSALTVELTAAGINDQNLEQALVDAVTANRIEHGIFFAERSSDSVHWHVYKKRNHEDNGAYIVTADSREGARSILDSLGTGQP